MGSLTWSASHAVWITEIDDEHKEIFGAASNLQEAFGNSIPLDEVRQLTKRLMDCMAGHFDHEERLMRAARYGSLRWHKKQHDLARRRVRQSVRRIEQGDTQAGNDLVAYLTAYLCNHTALADRMLGAFLRNERRGMLKMTFQAGTKPLDACSWTRANGDRFEPV